MPSVADSGSRVVRVFISSTFRDFEQERNLLAKDVFPELRRRARERFVEVMEVDLRWGITQEQSEQGLTLPICLREIERARPYFIGLLGERYGWTPTPGQYSELLLDQHAWLKEHMGGTSVTELEILHGVLRDPAMAGRAYFYFRDPAYSADRGPDFRSEGAIERAKLDELKSQIRSSPFPVVEYATPHEVAQRIIDDLWSWIDEQYPADEVPDELERARRSHESYAAERRRVFVGQEATVAAMLGRLESANDASRLTVVTGESGTGKSALLANVLAQYRAKHPHDQVIEHYLAAGYGAADPAKILRRLAAEIKRFTGTLKEIEASDDLLMQQLAEWLAEASAWAQQAGCSVIIALDGLDKLDESRSLAWLPQQMPPNVRVVVSTLAGESLDALRKRGEVELAAQPFSIQSARGYVIEALEKRRGKHLPAREIERIITHPRATLPIFLKTLVDELSVYGSFEGLPGRISQCLAAAEPDDLFEVILARLEDDMGRDSVQKPLEAIWASPGGLSDAELVGFTGVTPLELARLKLALGDALHEDRGMVMPAHDYLRKGIKDRYLESDELVSELHHRLGAWWELQESSERMGKSVNLHYYLARAWNDLERCLLDIRVGGAILAAVSTSELVCEWQHISDARGSCAPGEYLARKMSAVWRTWRDARAARELERTAARRLLSLCIDLRTPGSYSLALQVATDERDLIQSLTGFSPSVDTPCEWIRCLIDLGAAQRHVGELNSAGTTYAAVLAHASAASQSSGSADWIRLAVNVSNRLAEIAHAESRFDHAHMFYSDSITRSKSIPISERRTADDLAQGNALHNYLVFCQSTGDLVTGKRLCTEAEQLAERLLADPAAQIHASDLLTAAGTMHHKLLDGEAAQRVLIKSWTILKDACVRYHRPDDLRRSCVCLISLSDLHHDCNDIPTAVELLARARAISADYFSMGWNENRADLIALNHRGAWLDFAQGNLLDSETGFRGILAAVDNIQLSRNTADLQHILSDCHYGIGCCHTSRGNYGKAGPAFQASLSLYRSLNAGGYVDENSNRLWDIISSVLKCARLLGNAELTYLEPDQSRELNVYEVRLQRLTERLPLVTELSTRVPPTAGYLEECALFLEAVASACSLCGRREERALHAANAATLRSKITSLNPPA